MSVGLDFDNDRNFIFPHSHIPELNQLLVPFLTLVSVAELERNPTVKEEIQSANIKNVNAGMLVYPVHQACDILSVNANDFGKAAGNYYIRTITASPNVQERLQERVLLQEGKEIILAKGKAPADNQYVTVEFSLEGKDGKIIKAGEYENRVRYILREEER